MQSSLAPLLRLVGIGKRYGAVEALCGVDLDIAAGEVVAICGDNGAGKSTLIRIVSGAHEPTAGTIELDGRAVVFCSPIDALRAGVATIYQDLALAPRLPIWQNVFVGAELTRRLAPGVRVLDKRAMRAGVVRLSRAAQGRLARHRSPGGAAVRRPAAGRRDRARAPLERAPRHHGRADRRAGRRREPRGAEPHPRAAPRRHDGDPRQPQHGGSRRRRHARRRVQGRPQDRRSARRRA